MSIVIGDAVWRIGGDLTSLNEALDKSRKAMDANYKEVLAAGRKVGIGMTAVGGTIAAGLGVAVSAASEFQSGLNKLATLGVKDLDAAGEAVKNVVRLTGADLQDAFTGAYDAVSAGIPEENLYAFLEEGATAAVAGMTDFSTTVDYAKTMVNVFGTEVGDAMDQAFTAVRFGVTTFDELSGSIGKLAPTWKAAGLASDEMLASIAAVTKQGLSTSEAVTGLKAAFTNIIKPAGESAEIIEALGLEFDAASLKTKGWGQFLADLTEDIRTNKAEAIGAKEAIEETIRQYEEAAGGTEAYKKQLAGLRSEHEALAVATDEEIAILARLFGSIEGLNAVLALTSKEGAQDLVNIIGEMETRTGATREAFAAFVKDNPEQAWKALAGQMKVVAIDIGASLVPALHSLALSMSEVVEWVSNWINEHPRLTSALVAATALVAGLFLTLGPFLVVLPGIATAFSAAGAAIGYFTGSTAAATAAATANTAAVGSMGAAAAGAAHGIGIAAVGLLGLKLALIGVGVAITAGVVVAIGKLIQSWQEFYEGRAKGIELEERYTETLRQQGIEVDKHADKLAFSNEKLVALNQERVMAREAAARAEYDILLNRDITNQEFHDFEMARMRTEMDAASAATLARTNLFDYELEIIKGWSDGTKAAFRDYLQTLDITADNVAIISKDVRQALYDFSLDTRHSPSINDLVRASAWNTLNIYADLANGIASIVGSLHDTLSRLWARITDAAWSAWQSVTAAVRSIQIPGFADGGLVSGIGRRVAILAGEEGPEFATLPGGRRVLLGTHGPGLYAVPPGTYIHEFRETLRMLARGIPYAGAYASGGRVPAMAGGGGGVTVNVSIPSVSVREEVDVRRISEEIAARVSRAVLKVTR